MEFAVVECADRRFEDVCAQLRTEPAVALQLAADGQPPELRVDAGSVSVVGSEMAVVRADWRDGAAQPWLETELRVVGVNRGAEPQRGARQVGADDDAIRARQVQAHLAGSASDLDDPRIAGDRPGSGGSS